MATWKRTLLGLLMLVLTPIAVFALVVCWVSWALMVTVGTMEPWAGQWTFGIKQKGT